MPSLETVRRMMQSRGATVGQAHKNTSDYLMESTWDSDIQSKKAYIYDYAHDDQPMLNKGMTYEQTTKTPIDIKFIISEYGSLSKDQPSAKIQFKPSQTVDFTPKDDLYYVMERMYKYGMDDPFVGLYIDFPDEKGVYRKWMICQQDIQGNQFQKYLVLPCSYNLEWVRNVNNRRIKQRMWGVLRSQSSYNSGLWEADVFQTRENQEILFLPTNDVTDAIQYISQDNSSNQRLIVDVPCDNPNVWQVSKVERVNVRGRTKITLYQTEYNQHTDYIEKDSDGNIIGMWADYYSSSVVPTEEPTQESTITAEITATNNYLKVGGSYKLLTIKFYDEDGIEITNRYSSITQKDWSCSIDGIDVTDCDYITWLSQAEVNKMKIKVGDERTLLTKVLKVTCTVDGITASIDFDLTI